MRPLRKNSLLIFFAAGYLLVQGCSHSIPRLGTGGRYNEGREEILKGRVGNVDRAINALEAVVRENPTYKDSLTLLGRAYYRKERYRDAHMILQRALAVNKDDEIAWTVLGLTQLRLGESEKGLETLKGALTLLSRVSTNGYRDFEDWDSKGTVRISIRRAVFAVTKGLDEKEGLIRSVETVLSRMDDEERFQVVDSRQEYRRGYQGMGD